MQTSPHPTRPQGPVIIYALLALIPLSAVVALIYAYGINFPIEDEARRGFGFVLALENNDDPLGYVLSSPISAHITVPTQLVTWAAWAFADYNLFVMLAANLVMIAGAYGLLAFGVDRALWRVQPAVILVLALVVFTMRQGEVWITPTFSSLWFVGLFFVLALITLPEGERLVWWRLVLAGAGAVAATFSNGNGFLAWWVLLPLLLLRRYWLGAALWTAAGVWATLTFYDLSRATFNPAAGDTLRTVVMPPPLEGVRFVLAYVGGALVGWEREVAVVVGGVALVVFSVNALLLWLKRGGRAVLLRWLALAAFSLGTGTVAALTRYDWFQNYVGGGMTYYYVPYSVLFWVALVALVARGAAHVRGWPPVRRAAIYALNGGMALVFVLLYVPGGAHTFLAVRQTYTTKGDPRCYERYLFYQDRDVEQANCDIWWGRHANALSYHELALFAGREPVNMVAAAYTPGAPLVVEGSDGWANYNVQKWLLDGIDTANLYHVAPDEPDELGIQIALAHYTPPDAADELLAQLQDADSVWLLRRATLDSALGALEAALRDAGYVTTSIPLASPEDVPFTLTTYQRLETPAEAVRFGDDITLTGWQLPIRQVAACETLSFHGSFARGAEPLADGYSLTLTVAPPGAPGEAIARRDTQLALVPSEQWAAGVDYVGAHRVEVPCDAPPGVYDLSVGVYNYRDGRRLPVTQGGAATGDDLLSLVRLAVVAPGR